MYNILFLLWRLRHDGFPGDKKWKIGKSVVDDGISRSSADYVQRF